MSFEPLNADFYDYAALLTDEERDALAHAREVLEQQVRPLVDDAWVKGEFPRELVSPIVATGALGLGFEETRPFENSAVFRGFMALELGRIDAGAATFVGVQNGLALGAIGVCGSAEQRAKWLPKLASGELIGSFALTEPLSGSDSAQGLATTAELVGDEWVLNGEKRWIGNATWGDLVVVWAKDVADGQVKGFVVETSNPGYSVEKIENKIALRSVQNGHITLKDARIPAANKLEHANSFRDTAKVLRLTRAEVAWQAVGIAIGAYDAALAYAKERVQFGKPIAAHQLIQDKLVRSLGNITASIGMCVRVSQLLDEDRQADKHSALAKAFVAARMRETVALCREVVGGNGIVVDYGVAKFFADAEAIYSYEGTNEVNELIVGKAITGVSAFV